MILRSKTISVALCAWCCLAAPAVSAADTAPTPAAPPTAAPTPANPPTPATAPRLLHQVYVTSSSEAAQKYEVDLANGFVFVAPPLDANDAVELRQRLAAGENRAIDDRLLAAIVQVVEMFYRQRGHPTATAVIPPQSIAAGGVRVVVSLVNYPLKQIVLVDSVEAAQAPAAPATDKFVVLAPTLSFFKVTELTKRLAAGRDRMIDETLLNGIKEVVDAFAHENDLPAAAASIPAQDFSTGVVRVAVSLGRIRNIEVKGNRWFSDSLLREKLRIDRGRTLRLSELDQAVSWTNTSPYRRVKLQIDPVPQTGEADLIINVTEQFPIKATLSYDNSGNVLTGTDRYSASFAYGNLWGRDHQVGYTFATTNDLRVLQLHAFDYRAPLPWRHFVSVSGSYAKTDPSLFNGDFTQHGKSINADLRYVAPFKTKRWIGELSAGASYKQTNNNLEFGVVPVSFDTLEVFTVNAGIAAMREDLRGKWIGSLNITDSPGRVFPRSTKENFSQARIGADPRFVHGQLLVQRNTILAGGVTSLLRGVYQMASSNLVPTEEFALGGIANVRGYEERVIFGDSGYTLTHELYTRLPSVPLGQKVSPLDLMGVFFWDYGRAIIKQPLAYYDQSGRFLGYQTKSQYLASVGVGLRASLSTHFSASIDYARQLEELETPGAAHHRFHVKVSLAY